MAGAVNPTIRNIEGNENAAGPQNAKDFRKQLVLEFLGSEVVQHKDGKGRGKRLTAKRQLGGVTAHGPSRRGVMLQLEFESGFVIVLDGGNTGNVFP